MENIKWCFIENCEHKYILTSNGRVFSGKNGDYLKFVFSINFHFTFCIYSSPHL